jgi:RimJ/RimL family protein N-acetyltransferase
MADRKVRPTIESDFFAFEFQEDQKETQEAIKNNPGYAKALLCDGSAVYTAIDGDEIVGILGIKPDPIDPMRGYAWSLLSKNAGKSLLHLIKKVAFFIKNTHYRRIETTICHTFPSSRRWVELIGFEKEGTMRAYDKEGNDHDLYAIVRRV